MEALRSGQLSEDLQRQLRGAVEKLEQRGARAVTTECGLLLAFQGLVQQMGSKPAFTSSLMQWLAVSCVHAKDDEILVLTGDEQLLRSQTDLFQEAARLDLNESRFVVQSFKDVPGLYDVTSNVAVPCQGVEDAVVRVVAQVLEQHKGARAVLLECTDLLPYADAVRAATGLPVWDAVTGAELFSSMYLDYYRFELNDWVAEVLFEYGRQEIPPESGARKRILGVIGLDYENVKVETEYWVDGDKQYRVLFKSILDMTRYVTSLGKLTKACEHILKEALVWMRDEVGVCAITGDCGFMMSYQVLIRDVVDLPVCMSPLMFVRMLLPTFAEGERILIITASTPTLEEQKQFLLSHCGLDLNNRRIMVMGCEDIDGLTRLAIKGEMEDPADIRAAVLDRIRARMEEWPSVGISVGAIVVECAQLIPYTAAIRELTGLPVLDAIACSEFFVAARKQNDRFGIKQWPYVWDRTVEED